MCFGASSRVHASPLCSPWVKGTILATQTLLTSVAGQKLGISGILVAHDLILMLRPHGVPTAAVALILVLCPGVLEWSRCSFYICVEPNGFCLNFNAYVFTQRWMITIPGFAPLFCAACQRGKLRNGWSLMLVG